MLKLSCLYMTVLVNYAHIHNAELLVYVNAFLVFTPYITSKSDFFFHCFG